LWLDGADAGHRYASRYLALKPTDAAAAGIRLADRLMSTGGARPGDAERLLREAAPSALRDARLALTHAADSAEWAVHLARAMAAAPQGDVAWLSRAGRELNVGTTLLYRGHVRQAVDIIYRNPEALPIQMVEREPVDLTLPSEILWTLERGRVAERLGDREKAIRSYQYVAHIWRTADPELQPYATEAREGLARLTSEPKP
jgi:hypothetical protein